MKKNLLCVHTYFQLEGELNLAPSFPVPGNSDYKGYHTYIDEVLPPESPYLYGLHPNAEIGFLTATSDNLFKTVLEMQPRDAGGGEGGGATREEKVGYVGIYFTVSKCSKSHSIKAIFCWSNVITKELHALYANQSN
jgi:hypothetical protein